MSDEQVRLAVLIDADNISAKVAKDIFEELAGYGTLTVKRAYGDWTTTRLNGWKDQLHAHAISPMQQFAYTTGKNSTDSALIIDAMDLLYAGHLDGFVIVSSDSDFTRLATRLREAGKTVYGVGARKTPQAFRDACDKFTFLEVLRADATEPEPERPRRTRRSGPRDQASGAPETPASDEPEVEPTEPSGHDSDQDAATDSEPTKRNLESMLAKALNKTASDDDDWSALGALGSHLNRTDPSFDARTYGFARLSDLVKAQPFLETQTVKTSSGQGQLWVRLKRRRAAAKPAEPEQTPPAESAPSTPSAPSAPPDAEATPSAPEQPAAKPAKKATTRRTTKKAAVAEAEADEPVVEKPVVEKPVVEKPVVEKPVVEEPEAEKPVAKKAAAKKTGGRTTRKVTATKTVAPPD